MCDPVSITATTLAAAGSIDNARNNSKFEGQQVDAQRRQQREMVKQMNWSNADGQLDNIDNAEQARMALTETNITRMNNMATLSTALGETGMSGRTADRLKMVGNIQADMEDSNISLNYRRDYQAIFGDMIGRAESTKAGITGMAPIQRTSKLSQAVGIAGTGLSTYASTGGTFGVGKADKGSVRGKAGVKGTSSVPYGKRNRYNTTS